MNVFLGSALILVGVAAAAFGALTGFVSGRRRSLRGLAWTETATYVFAGAMLLANLVMVRALVSHDFSVSYVAQVGSRATPLHITIVSLWSSLEGSILFWGAILGLYLAAFVFFNRDRYRDFMAYALGTALVVATFFALLLAGPADPFRTVSPVPADGPGPNPLLQNHPLMIIHPPMLYLGYVGMSIPFAVAIAALLRARMTDGWLKVLRRWTMVPWIFLSCGIVFGGWWAYEVLGWGGYWAWDPVENASFLPWLAATGYLHSTVVQERRRILKAWTLSLVLGAFLLTVLGTFMTRSGVFNSVHSFTQSSIGPFFLVFLGIALVGSMGLLAGRAHLLEPEGRIATPVSREGAFLLNNVLFVIFTFTVLLGTVFPLITEAVRGVKVSVGEPYFDRMAVPIGLLLVFLMGVGPALPWGRPERRHLMRGFVVPGLVGFGVAAVCWTFGVREPLPLLTFGLCGFAGFVTLREMVEPALERKGRRAESFAAALKATAAGNRRRFGGYVVHFAVVIIVAAIAGSNNYRQQTEASLLPGESMQLDEYEITFVEAGAQEHPHRFTVTTQLEVRHEGEPAGTMAPRMNFYPQSREPIFTPHVRTFGVEDLYASLVGFDPETRRASIRLYSIPMVPLIWWSLPVLVLGGALGLWPRKRRAPAVAPEGAVPS